MFPSHLRNQEVISPSHPSIAKGGRNANPFDAPIYGSLAVNGPFTSYSRVIGLEVVSVEFANFNAHERINFASNYLLVETPKFVDFGLSPANTADKLNSVFSPATIAGELTDNSNWLASRHGISEVTEGRVIEEKAYSDYIKTF